MNPGRLRHPCTVRILVTFRLGRQRVAVKDIERRFVTLLKVAQWPACQRIIFLSCRGKSFMVVAERHQNILLSGPTSARMSPLDEVGRDSLPLAMSSYGTILPSKAGLSESAGCPGECRLACGSFLDPHRMTARLLSIPVTTEDREDSLAAVGFVPSSCISVSLKPCYLA